MATVAGVCGHLFMEKLYGKMTGTYIRRFRRLAQIFGNLVSNLRQSAKSADHKMENK